MNDKYEIEKVKAWLSEYKENERDVEDQLERLARMQARMEKCNAPEITDMPRASGFQTDRLSMMMARKIDMENSIKNYLERQALYLDRIEYVVEKLPFARERQIIRLRYEDGEKWVAILQRMYGDADDFAEREASYNRTMFQSHNDALQKIAVFLNNEDDPNVMFYRDYVPRMLYYS